MTARVVTLADAAVAFLNSPAAITKLNDIADARGEPSGISDFVISFTAQRKNRPVTALEDLKALEVFVGPFTRTSDIETRETIGVSHVLLVTIQNHVDSQAEEDLIIELTEQIEDVMFAENFGEWQFFEFEGTDQDRSVFNAEALAVDRVFHTFIQLRYIGELKFV